jgi:hypothetical protein
VYAMAPPPPQPVSSQTVQVQSASPLIDTELAEKSKGATLHGTPARQAAASESYDRKDDKSVQAKLSADLLTLYHCSQKRAASATVAACKLPASGKVVVEVQLSAAADQKLKLAGLKINSGAGTTRVTGQIEVAKLETLARLAEVTSVIKAAQQ